MERLGKQICESHWRRHKDSGDSFDLFDAFGFERPPGIRKSIMKNNVPRCDCGRERLPERKFCKKCAAERERQRKKRAYHERKNRPLLEPVEQKPILRCKACGAERQRGHTYCEKCAERRKKISHRQRQSRYWKRQHNCTGLN